VVGEHAVTAGSFEGCGQRPRPRDLHLEPAGVSLRELFEHVELLLQYGPGPAMVDARCVGEPPTGGLQVEAEPADDRGRPSHHLRRWSECRRLDQMHELRQLSDNDPLCLADVGSGHRADPGGGSRHGQLRTAERVREIVADPTTRVPS
jgi:hypothetical protein